MDERRAVGRVVRRLVDAWNRGDPQRFAELFTVSAEYVMGSGRKVRGREEIAELVEQAGPASVVDVAGPPVVEVRHGSATARFVWVTRGAENRGGTIHCTLGLHGARWLIEMLRNDEGERPRDRPANRP